MLHSADRMAALSGVSAGRILRMEEEADEEWCVMRAPQNV
jgi:hypothetical protein